MTRTLSLVSLLAFVLALLFATPFASAVGTTPPSWKAPVQVDAQASPDANTSNQCVAFDHHGNPGIAWVETDLTSNIISYGRFARGLGWVWTYLDEDSDCAFPSLAFDFYERPWIAYTKTGQIHVARFDGLSWQIAIASGSLPSCRKPTICFDILGNAAIAFESDNVFRSIYFSRDLDADGFGDETPVVATPTGGGGADFFSPSLAFDHLNRPMIAATFNNNATAFAVREPGVGWSWATINTDNVVQPSLAINPVTGRPAIAWSNYTNIRYAEWTGSTWSISNVSAGSSPANCDILSVSLAFDPSDGRPAIASTEYGSFCTGAVRFTWFDGTSWTTQIAAGFALPGGASNTCSLAFNDYGTGFPSIAYFLGNDLWYVEDPPAADINGDFFVGIEDLLNVLTNWGACQTKQCPADIAPQPDGDGSVGIADLLLVIGSWS